MFERYNLVAAPVVDARDRLVGVITFDDVVDVIEEEAEEDIKALGGVTRDEELSDSVWTIARGRFNWLLVNLATAFLASSVLGLFEGQLQKMVALAVLAPIVASQGGNATTQTMTVAVRALATQELTDANAWRVIMRELSGRAAQRRRLRRHHRHRGLCLVPGAGPRHRHRARHDLQSASRRRSAAFSFRWRCNRLRVDPAVASSPFVTTVTDVVGFFSFLSIATLWFGLR